MRKKAILIGLGGDSGSGKHTSVTCMEQMVGAENLLHVSGDDYHKWPRGHEEWKTHTHLQPRANHLDRFCADIQALKDGKTVQKPIYDHTTGQFTEPVETKPRQYVVVSGLHPFWDGHTRALFDLKIFLQPDENLRWHWKIIRDMEQRGYTMSQVIAVLRQRERDSVEYILPQAQYADLKITPYVPRGIEAGNKDQRLDLRVRYLQRGHVDLMPFIVALRERPGFSLKSFQDNFSDAQSLDIGGSLSAVEVGRLASDLVPNISALTKKNPVWQEDYLGLFQILFLLNIRACAHRP